MRWHFRGCLYFRTRLLIQELAIEAVFEFKQQRYSKVALECLGIALIFGNPSGRLPIFEDLGKSLEMYYWRDQTKCLLHLTLTFSWAISGSRNPLTQTVTSYGIFPNTKNEIILEWREYYVLLGYIRHAQPFWLCLGNNKYSHEYNFIL